MASATKTTPAAGNLSAAMPSAAAAAFVRKVYAILSLQFALTAAAVVAATACFVGPIRSFFVHGPPAVVWPTIAVVVVLPPIVMFRMVKYRENNPRNLALLALFTLSCKLCIVKSTSTTLG